MEDDFVMSYPLGHGVRSMDADDLDYWCPSVDVVNQEDLEKMKTENERNAR